MFKNNNKEPVEKDSPTLLILGIVSITIAVITTCVSLYVYKKSGDIYLDRSRPGFLPDDEDRELNTNNYKFSDSGAINEDVINEYLQNLKKDFENLDALEDPFSTDSLSDESLGISETDEPQSSI